MVGAGGTKMKKTHLCSQLEVTDTEAELQFSVKVALTEAFECCPDNTKYGIFNCLVGGKRSFLADCKA